MQLQYLEFDLGEDSDGWTSASALACPAVAHQQALHAEVQGLLQALEQRLGAPGPLDEGHRWDMDLQLETEDGRSLPLPALLAACDSAAPAARITLALHLAGDDALKEQLHAWTAN